MNFDELQQAWQSQGAGRRITINADLLLREVRRNQRSFDRAVFWRDVREIVLPISIPAVLYWGVNKPVWDVYLWLLAWMWVSGFLLVDRWRHRKRQPVSSDPLQGCIERSLGKVDQQIWLLKNVAWISLLPYGIAMAGTTVSLASKVRTHWIFILFGFGGYTAFYALVWWRIYRLNQKVVRKFLEPRRQELEIIRLNLNQ